MGYGGGLLGFVVSVIVCVLLAVIFLPTLPWVIPALMLVGSACVVGVVLSLLMAWIAGFLPPVGLGLTRLAALLFVALVIVLTVLAWLPVLRPTIALLQSSSNNPAVIVMFVRIAPMLSALGVVGLLVVLFAQLVLSGISYTVGAVAYGTAGRSPLENEARGGCAGVNAAVNMLLGFGVIPLYLRWALGPIFGGLMAVLVLVGIFVASVIPFRRNPVSGIVAPAERTAIAWLVCLLPSAWLMELLGLFLFMTSLVVHATVGIFVPSLSITGVALRADTGSVIVTGGMAGNLNPAPTYNIGTFTFVRTITPAVLTTLTGVAIYNDALLFANAASIQNHEIGHQLNLAAFGTAFNLVGFVDEWVGPLVAGGGYAVYGEDLASTNDPSPQPFFPTPLSMWVI